MNRRLYHRQREILADAEAALRKANRIAWADRLRDAANAIPLLDRTCMDYFRTVSTQHLLLNQLEQECRKANLFPLYSFSVAERDKPARATPTLN